jgi:O-antigen/teichoic acid export membrane protein
MFKYSYILKYKTLKKYAQNTSWLLAEKIFRIVISLFVGVWIANHLGAESFGLLNYGLSIVGLVACFSNLGLENIIVRELVHHPENKNTILNTAIWLRVIGALFSIIALVVPLLFMSRDRNFTLLIFVMSLGMLFNAMLVIDLYYNSRVEGKVSAIVKISALLASSIGRITLIILNAELIWFAASTAFDSLFLSSFLYISYRVREKTGLLKLGFFDPSEAKRLLKFSWPLIISGFVVSLYMKIDQIMIKFILSENDVGIYAVAVRLSESLNFLPIIFSTSLFPAIIKSKQLDRSVYHARLRNFYTLIIWSAIAFALALSLSSSLIVNFLYSNEYIYAADILTVHVWSSVFVFIGVAGSKLLISENLQRYITLNTATGALINIGLNYYLLPKFGIIGAAWATLISYALATYLLQALWYKTRFNFLLLSKSFIPKKGILACFIKRTYL